MNPTYIVAKFEDRYTFMPAAYNKEYEMGVFQMTVNISSSKIFQVLLYCQSDSLRSFL